MTKVNPNIRLSKLAKEFNVGISTIVEFLNKKGIKIDSNPNTKVSEETYNILAKEYSSDFDLKKESEKVILAGAKEKKETISIDDVELDKESVEENKESINEEIFNNNLKTPQSKIKVIGKIDLEELKTPTVSPKKTNVPKVIEEEPKPEKPVKAPESKPETPTDKQEVLPKKETDDKTSEDIKEPAEKQEETISAVTDLKDEVKVVGKIDLKSLNQKTRPARKTQAEKNAERKAKATGETQGGLPASQAEKTKDVATTTKHPEVQRSDEDDDGKKKRKRKRIKKENEKIVIENKQTKVDSTTKKSEKFTKLKKKQGTKKEISEEDVQKQIKDTLARLTKGKSKAAKYRRDKRELLSQKQQELAEQIEAEKKTLKLTEFVTVNELSSMMEIPVTQIISTCMGLGLFVSINQRMDAEAIVLVADEFDYKVEFVSVELQESIEEEVDSEEDLEFRPPIVTVMGHVDHGKTSLLDYIRDTNVIAGEAGGITQHIGAYNVTLKDNRKITFLDTPGHEAFTAMRARGAQVTDIAIIIVAADDDVMPQTVEAINHASAAGVPIVFAINKIDKPGADVEKIKGALANINYMVEDWGGKYQCQEISAKKGTNVEELLEKVLLEAEMLDLKANPNKRAIGSVIESSLDKGRGYITTLLVQGGTLKIGDMILAGSYTGNVKAMHNERGQNIEQAGPAEPALVLGLNGAPQAGDNFNVMESEKEARNIANKREQLQREQGLRTQKHITLDEIGRRIAIGNFQELNIVVKGDVDGSIEALSDSLIKLSTEEIQVNVIHKAVGQISESDVLLATASNAIIVGFQVRPSMGARKLAEKEEIDIRLYSIIYDAIAEVKSAMEGMLSPEIKEEISATVEILEIFKITKVGTVGGCMVRDGKIKRSSKVRIIRDGIVIYTGELGSLKRFKEDVKEVAKGYECGLNITNYNDIKVGDMIEAFEEVEVKKTL